MPEGEKEPTPPDAPWVADGFPPDPGGWSRKDLRRFAQLEYSRSIAAGGFPYRLRVGAQGEWELTLWLAVREGRLVCYDLELGVPGRTYGGHWTPPPQFPAGGITSRLLHSITLGSALTGAANDLRERAGPIGDEARRHIPTGGRRGRKGNGDDHYLLVAMSYLLALKRDPRRPVQWMAEDWQVSKATVRDWVAEARRRSFLSKGRQGKPGAVPGPRGDRVLNTLQAKIDELWPAEERRLRRKAKAMGRG